MRTWQTPCDDPRHGKVLQITSTSSRTWEGQGICLPRQVCGRRCSGWCPRHLQTEVLVCVAGPRRGRGRQSCRTRGKSHLNRSGRPQSPWCSRSPWGSGGDILVQGHTSPATEATGRHTAIHGTFWCPKMVARTLSQQLLSQPRGVVPEDGACWRLF